MNLTLKDLRPTRMLLLLLAVLLTACSSTNDDGFDLNETDGACLLPSSELASGGVPKDGIPALTDPRLVSPDEATYLTDDSRIIGLFADGQPLAVPHNILWWHEIINFDLDEGPLAVTYCPLTGSSMAFDRTAAGGAEFGVSGLLFQNNLIMYDRNSSETLWPQMMAQGGCGARAGTTLPMQAVFEMTWGGWKALYPNTLVISSETGHVRDYTERGYPYGNYEVPTNTSLLFDMPLDDRRPPKERVLGVPGVNDRGLAFPFGELDAGGTPFNVVEATVEGDRVVVFWSREAQSAMAFRPAGRVFMLEGGAIIDTDTGSTWAVDGRAVAGPLAGTQLEPVDEAFVAFWFAWAAFVAETELWAASGV